MRIRAKFERFQEYYVMNIQFRDPNSPCTSAKMYVGKYFTVKGEFDEVMMRLIPCKCGKKIADQCLVVLISGSFLRRCEEAYREIHQ